MRKIRVSTTKSRLLFAKFFSKAFWLVKTTFYLNLTFKTSLPKAEYIKLEKILPIKIERASKANMSKVDFEVSFFNARAATKNAPIKGSRGFIETKQMNRIERFHRKLDNAQCSRCNWHNRRRVGKDGRRYDAGHICIWDTWVLVFGHAIDWWI